MKIDGRLVHDLTAEPTNQTVVKKIAELTYDMGIDSVAMHVPDDATAELLRQYGIRNGQSWHLGKPRSLAELW